jgi:HD-like signal output (HDOD) protein
VNPVTYDILIRRVKQLGNLPAMPAILASLGRALSVQASKIDVEKVIQTISYDKSLTAQCLRIANSALFHQRGDVTTVKEAVLSLGLWRIRDLAFSCSLPFMFPNVGKVLQRDFFWRHALGSAILAQELGLRFGEKKHEHAYLAGLLHDIGILVNGVLFAEDFRNILDETVRDKSPIEVAEQRILGFTHCESGRILAELWRLPLDVSEVIEFHHNPSAQKPKDEVTAMVQVADLLCWANGLGYGFGSATRQSKTLDEAWEILTQHFPKASAWSREEYASFVGTQIAKACELADQVFSPAPVAK